MSEECKESSCSSCGVSSCGDRKVEEGFDKPNASSNIKKVIGVVSGKGGVGKSSVTSMMAVAMANQGKVVGVMDADMTGPSIPKAFGYKDKARASAAGILPGKTEKGISIMSVNMLLQDETDPVIWRGPVIGNMVKQFWSDVAWGEIDYMFIDMPPGTGDVALTVFQSLPVDGLIIVTSPQELVSMIVAKAVKMAAMMEVPVIGLVENFSYFHCPDNGKDYEIFGKSHIEDIAKEYNLEVLAKLPINPEIARMCDAGEIENADTTPFNGLVEIIEKIPEKSRIK